MTRSRLPLLIGCLLLGFLAVLAVRARPADPEARLPRQYRLADLIEREERLAVSLRRQVSELRREVDTVRVRQAGRHSQAQTREAEVKRLMLTAGFVRLSGPGLRVTLDDSELDEAPSGNVNDLVIHSQDVQAVVNALWRADADAIAINGQRLVGTSAVLCVGNTLLLNGTVHSPPYVVSAVGASRDRFETDRLVRRLHDDADAFGLRFSVTRVDDLEIPAFRGATGFQYAKPVASQ